MEQLLGEVSLDKKRRLALGRLLQEKQISSFEIYKTDDGYFLKPKVSIPIEELWLFQNKKAKASLAKGLAQKPEHDMGSFAKYAEDK